MSRALFLILSLMLVPVPPASAQTALNCAALADPQVYVNGKGHLKFITADDATGWLLRSPDLRSDFLLDEEAQTLMATLTRTLHDRYGTQLLAVLPPPRGLFAPHAGGTRTLAENYGRFLDEIRAAGIIAPDLLAAATSSPEARDGFYFKRDTHWTPLGARIAAQAVAKALQDAGLHDPATDLPRFQLSGDDSFKMTGTLAKRVQEICGYDVPAESVTFPSVVPVEVPADQLADALFGAATAQDEKRIVVVGTSFGMKNRRDLFHWGDWLRLALQNDVTNRSVTGGGFVTAFESYALTALPEERPDFLIWEFLLHYLGDWSAADLRQLIGAVAGPCPATGIRQELELTSGTWTKLPATFPTSDVIELTLPGMPTGRVEIGVAAPDGTARTLRLDRDDRFPADARSGVWRAYLGGFATEGSNLSLSVRVKDATTPLMAEVTACGL